MYKKIIGSTIFGLSLAILSHSIYYKLNDTNKDCKIINKENIKNNNWLSDNIKKIL